MKQYLILFMGKLVNPAKQAWVEKVNLMSTTFKENKL